MMSDLIERAESASRGLSNLGMDSDSELIDELITRIKKLQTQLANITALCSQEGNDGEPWGTIYALAERNK